jgi:hypothetical protein
MKTSLLLGGVLSVALFASNALAAKAHYKATFVKQDGVTGNPTGSAALTYDDVAGKLCGTVTYAGLTGPVTAAHIHESAGIVVGLTAAASPMPIDVSVDSGQATKIAGGGTYINLHTTMHGAGEIKGDIVADPAGTDQCAKAASDAGTDGGSTSSSSSSSSGGSTSSSSGGSSSSSSSGATTVRADSGTESAAPAEDDGGCSTTGSKSAPGNGLLIALGLGVAVAGVARGRKSRKNRH